MAGFCSGCGTAIADGVKFCPACGKAAGPAEAPAAAPLYPSSPAPASGGGALKIILIVLGILALIGILMLGSCFYFAYRVKKVAHEMAGDTRPYSGKKDPCSFVSVKDASQALGVPVQEAVERGPMGCDYTLGTDGYQHMMVGFTWQGGRTVMKMTHGAMKMGGAGTVTDLPGVGDEAFEAPGGSSIVMVKGDVMVNIALAGAGLNPDGGKKIATMIADKLP